MHAYFKQCVIIILLFTCMCVCDNCQPVEVWRKIYLVCVFSEQYSMSAILILNLIVCLRIYVSVDLTACWSMAKDLLSMRIFQTVFYECNSNSKSNCACLCSVIMRVLAWQPVEVLRRWEAIILILILIVCLRIYVVVDLTACWSMAEVLLSMSLPAPTFLEISSSSEARDLQNKHKFFLQIKDVMAIRWTGGCLE